MFAKFYTKSFQKCLFNRNKISDKRKETNPIYIIYKIKYLKMIKIDPPAKHKSSFY